MLILFIQASLPHYLSILLALVFGWFLNFFELVNLIEFWFEGNIFIIVEKEVSKAKLCKEGSLSFDYFINFQLELLVF